MSLAGSNGGRLLLKSNRDGFRADKDKQGSCSLHGTLHRDKRLRSDAGGRMWGSKEGGCNNPDLTMDDDVFDDVTPSPLPGLMAAVACRGSGGGVGSHAIFINPPDSHQNARLNYISKGKCLSYL